MSTLVWESTKCSWNKELRDRWHLGFLVQSLTAKAFLQHSLVLQPTLSTHLVNLVTRPIQDFSPHSPHGNPLAGAHFWNRTSCTWPGMLHIFKLCKLKSCYTFSACAKSTLSFAYLSHLQHNFHPLHSSIKPTPTTLLLQRCKAHLIELLRAKTSAPSMQ